MGGGGRQNPIGRWFVSGEIRAMRKLQVSPDGHFFQDETGAPFFYLADTAWLLFNKLKLEEVRRLFEDRKAKGFNAIQAVIFRDLFEPNSPNVYGVRPFESEEDMWAVNLNPKWMDHVRKVVEMAREMELYLGLLPTWGDKWNEHSNSAGPVILDAHSAREYGRYLSDSLQEYENILWLLGGDSPIQSQAHADIVHAMAAGTRSGGSADRLMTFHSCHDAASEIFHAAEWLDFNCFQSGHAHPNIEDYLQVERQYRIRPYKPCLNSEANFEACPMFVMQGEKDSPPYEPLFSDYDVRKCLYRSVLAGGAGFVYGCEPIRQLYRKGDRVHVFARYDMPEWTDVLDAPGAGQMRILPDILKSRAYFTRVPAQELLLPLTRFIGVAMNYEVPGNDHPAAHIRVASCTLGGYVMAYCPVRQLIQLDTSGMDAKRLRVTLYDPATGDCEAHYDYTNTGVCTIVPKRDLDTFVVVDAVD